MRRRVAWSAAPPPNTATVKVAGPIPSSTSRPALAAMPASSFALLALGGFLASFVGQIAFYHSLKLGHLSQVTPVSGTYPLVAALLGWWLLREPLSPSRVLGVCLIIAGVWLLRR